MNKQRVVITGLGCISALGKNHNEFWDKLISGVSGISRMQNVACQDLRFQSAGEIFDFDSTHYFSTDEAKWLDRFSQFALIAATEAVENAKLNIDEINNNKTSVITGSCAGGKITEDEAYYRVYNQNKKTIRPNTISNVMANAGASHIAAKFGITGPVFTYATACSSSTHAIGHAFWMIRNGIITRAIAGGSEAPLCFGNLKAWEALRVVTSDVCRPFSKNRSGMIIGEGGAMLVLESLSSAVQRKAPIYAEIIGFGMSSDAAHITDPSTKGQCLAINAAIDDAAILPTTIQYINAHGTGTLVNDRTETETIKTVFPTADKHMLVSSTKAAHGHMLGATGAIESIATILAVKNNIIPPTINFSENDSQCDIPLVVNQAQESQVNYAMCSSFAFGGLNAILLFSQYQE